MVGAGWGLGTWGCLLLLGLCSWTGACADPPSPVGNLRVDRQTNSSITLSWDAPDDQQSYTYWVQWTGPAGSSNNENTAQTTYTVQGLKPGTLYAISVWVKKDGFDSSWQNLTAHTAPSPVQNLTVDSRTNSSISLNWIDPDNHENCTQYNCSYWVQWTGPAGNLENSTKEVSTKEANYTLQGLESGSSYIIFVWVDKNDLNSSRQTLTAFTVPNPVRNLREDRQTNSSITLSWDAPDDQQNYTYWVQWTGPAGNLEDSTAEPTYTIVELEPETSYDISVWVEKNGLNSSRQNLTASTVPNPVRNLTLDSQTNSSIILSWAAPDDQQNYIYWVQWTGPGGNSENRNTTETTFTIKSLEPGTSYEISVWVEKNKLSSSRENLTAHTVPNPVRNLRVDSQTNSSITLSWAAPDDQQNYTYWVQWTGTGGNPETRNTTETTFTIEELEPRTSYEISVWVEKNKLSSSRENLTAHTAPNPVRNLTVDRQTNTSITLSWAAPDDQQSYTYWVQWTGPGGNPENRNTIELSYIIEELEPGTSYDISVWVEKNGLSSSRQDLEAHTVPNPVRNLRVDSQTNNSITLSWAAPDDQQNYTYWVQWTGPGGNSENRNTIETTFIIEELEPRTSYEISVWVEKNKLSSSRENLTAHTVPNPVRNLRVDRQTTSSITLSWDAPDDQQSYTYWVQWMGPGGNPENRYTTETTYTIVELEPGTSYDISMWVEKNELNSSRQDLEAHTAPNSVLSLRNETQTNRSVTLRWQAPSDPHSGDYTYRLQWVPGGPEAKNQTKDTWFRVEALEPGTLYNFSVWAEINQVASSTQQLQATTAPVPVIITSCASASGGYGVILTWPCPPGGYEAFRLEVGGQLSSLDASSCGRAASVQGLQPARSYWVTVTTLWAGLAAPSAAIACHTDSAGVIAGSIVGILLFLLLVGLLLFFLKKRSLRRKKNKEKLIAGAQVYSFPLEIPAEEFADYVKENEKDSNCGFSEQYQQLALEDPSHAQMVASAPENSAKNRYRNVLPYDWSRVTLQLLPGEPYSDYINANFIPGLYNSQEFIATQGPLPQTVGDFWRLVWEQQSHTLVMLTNCTESGRVKCEHYWPLDAQPCTHGLLQVTLESEQVSENWTVRDLRLRHIQLQRTLLVRQFHYTTWPDHGVPHSPDPLLNFRELLRQWLSQTAKGGPPIMHCSAGVGRSGTLIALDVLLQQLDLQGVVGPYNFVRKMRDSRPLMVQTEAQYVFLHHCILRFLQQKPRKRVQEASYDNPIYENVITHREAPIYENLSPQSEA